MLHELLADAFSTHWQQYWRAYAAAALLALLVCGAILLPPVCIAAASWSVVQSERLRMAWEAMEEARAMEEAMEEAREERRRKREEEERARAEEEARLEEERELQRLEHAESVEALTELEIWRWERKAERQIARWEREEEALEMQAQQQAAETVQKRVFEELESLWKDELQACTPAPRARQPSTICGGRQAAPATPMATATAKAQAAKMRLEVHSAKMLQRPTFADPPSPSIRQHEPIRSPIRQHANQPSSPPPPVTQPARAGCLSPLLSWRALGSSRSESRDRARSKRSPAIHSQGRGQGSPSSSDSRQVPHKHANPGAGAGARRPRPVML